MPKTVAKNLPQGIKRLSWEELQKRREKGLCFNCDERFTPGHKCSTRQAFLVEPASSDEDNELEATTEADKAEIYVHAMIGVKGPRTIWLGSWIRNRRVIVLIDNGSSHNFINQELSKKINLKVETVEPFHVKVANGEKIVCTQQYRAVPIRIQGITITADLFSLPLGDLMLYWGYNGWRIGQDFNRL